MANHQTGLGNDRLRLNPRLLGGSIGLVVAAGLSLATLWLVMRGGEQVGPHLALLGHYLPGYAVTGPGALAGFLYGLLLGGGAGWLLGAVYNRLAGRRR